MFAERTIGAGLLLAGIFSGAVPAFAQGPTPTGRMAAAAATPTTGEDVRLAIGEQRVIPSDGVRSYSEGAKGIVDVRLTKDASEFIVVALAPGTTTLLFLMMDGSERHYRFAVSDPKAPAREERKDSRSVEARDNVRLDFYFVQVTKSYGHQIGMGWPGSVAPRFAASFDVQAGAFDSATAVISDQALPRLDMAQVRGWAKVMRQAAVVTANGEKASFAGGGEVNVAVQGALTSGVHKIPFGSVVEVEPRYDSGTGRIELRLHADISELQDDRGSGVPGRLTSALDTIVNVEIGQSIVLAGLTARSERSSKTGIPGLSQIPILGVLFGSHVKAEDESENVVIIVPSVVDTVSMQNRERLNDALRTYTDYDGDLDEVDLVPEAPRGKPAPKAAPPGKGLL